MDHEKTLRFLRALTALAHEYGLKIGGCGCCDSPWVKPLAEGDEHLAYAVALETDDYSHLQLRERKPTIYGYKGVS